METSVDFAYETMAVNQNTANTFGTTPGTMLPDRKVGFSSHYTCSPPGRMAFGITDRSPDSV